MHDDKIMRKLGKNRFPWCKDRKQLLCFIFSNGKKERDKIWAPFKVNEGYFEQWNACGIGLSVYFNRNLRKKTSSIASLKFDQFTDKKKKTLNQFISDVIGKIFTNLISIPWTTLTCFSR